MGWDLQKLNPRHFKIIELRLRGKTNIEIADELNMHANAVSIIIHSPNFQREYAMQSELLAEKKLDSIAREHENVQTTVEQKLKEATLKAVDTLTKRLDSEDESISMRASESILDRGGHGKRITTENVETLNITLSNKDAKRIADALILDTNETAQSS